MIKFESMYGNDLHFIVTWDLNARVGGKADYVENENSFVSNILPDGYAFDVELPRISQDKCVNKHGKNLLDFCKSTGLRILNGRCGVDSNIGKFTFVSTQGWSVVDYVNRLFF